MIALWDADDQWNSKAYPVWCELTRVANRYVTTPEILLECGNAAARKPHRRDVCDLRRILSANGDILAPSEDELLQSWDQYAKGHPGGPSIVDCISFEVMRRLGIREAFTNDRHFAEAGYVTLY